MNRNTSACLGPEPLPLAGCLKGAFTLSEAGNCITSEKKVGGGGVLFYFCGINILLQQMNAVRTPWCGDSRLSLERRDVTGSPHKATQYSRQNVCVVFFLCFFLKQKIIT